MAPSDTSSPEYRVEDRSLLLPLYRRFFVEPILPLIPARISPNAITHLGHLLCFAAAALLLTTWPSRGWPFVVTIALVWGYVFCDNADGAHARRTNQCSALGEFLDHGLDLLNVAYLACVTAMAIGAPPLVWVLICIGLPAAAAIVYWEQAELGVFRLGLLNQVESSVALTVALLVSACLGTAIMSRPLFMGISASDLTAAWLLATTGFGMLRGVGRVAMARADAKHGGTALARMARLGPAVALIAFDAALVGSYASGALTAIAVIVVGILANLAFGVRMLSFRLQRRRPKTDLAVLAGALAVTIATLLGIDARWALGLTVGGGVVFALQGAMAARTSLRALRA